VRLASWRSGFHDQYDTNPNIPRAQLLPLYALNEWSSAPRPDELCEAIANSPTVISAWDNDLLVGLGNAITDGHLVVYFPHLLVHPAYRRQGIGTEIVNRLKAEYEGFHQQILVSKSESIPFYESCGFVRPGKHVPMVVSSRPSK